MWKVAGFVSVFLFSVFGCSNPQPGPDKTLGGAVLGAGWGAGAGAVAGNQVEHPGEGVAIGAGFGAVSGALTGAGFDLNESALLEQENALASLRTSNIGNRRQLVQIQDKLDSYARSASLGGVYQVFFDPDATNLRAGAVANLQTIAESMQRNPSAYRIHVVGHSDDNGTPEYNERLALARARTVSGYLAARGISMDQIMVSSFGAERPIATNATPVGRQLNRRVDVFLEGDK
ncbi:MAG: OmpA family protein [Bdellovibrionales bacterium]|nr:OmpA family protein [Bdellovibrionales bacterium]